MLLEEEGFEVNVGSSGQRALDLLDTMPHMSGREFLSIVKDRYPKVMQRSRIVGLSFYDRSSSFVNEMVDDLDEFVPKPVDLKSFIKMAQEQIQKPKKIN